MINYCNHPYPAIIPQNSAKSHPDCGGHGMRVFAVLGTSYEADQANMVQLGIHGGYPWSALVKDSDGPCLEYLKI